MSKDRNNLKTQHVYILDELKNRAGKWVECSRVTKPGRFNDIYRLFQISKSEGRSVRIRSVFTTTDDSVMMSYMAETEGVKCDK